MREVKRLFEDYKENIIALKRYEQQQIKDQAIKVGINRIDIERVQGGILHKEEKRMTKRIDRANASINAIKRIKADLRPFLLAMHKLSKEQKELLRSRYMKSSSVYEVAKEFDLSLATTKTKLSQAETRFYRLYQKYSNELA